MRIARGLQQHVAVTFYHRVGPTSSVSRAPWLEAKWSVAAQTQARWNSTAADHTATESKRPEASKMKGLVQSLPPGSYVDSPTYPKLQTQFISPPSNNVNLVTTRAAPLEAPEELQSSEFPQGQIPLKAKATYFFGLGKAYLKLYKTGLWNVLGNRKAMKSIKERLGANTINDAAKYGRAGSKVPPISRNEYQMCLRAQHDVFKLAPFVLVFAICGEFTPLAVIALGSAVVPRTCRIPRQEAKDLQNSLKRDERSNMTPSHFSDGAASSNAGQLSPELGWSDAYNYGLTMFSRPFPVIGNMYYKYVIERRLQRHCEELLCDTLLIEREGGFRKLAPRDIFEWADKYALYSFRQHVRKALQHGKDPCSDEMKKDLLPALERETRWILNRDWTRLNPEAHWLAAYASPLSDSPDGKKRWSDMVALHEKSEEMAKKSN